MSKYIEPSLQILAGFFMGTSITSIFFDGSIYYSIFAIIAGFICVYFLINKEISTQ